MTVPVGDAEVPLLFSAGRTGGYQVHVAWPGSPPAVTSLEAGPSLNQEAVVGHDGVVTTVFQLAVGGRYVIAVAEASRAGWTSPTVISTSEDHNAWDPRRLRDQPRPALPGGPRAPGPRGGRVVDLDQVFPAARATPLVMTRFGQSGSIEDLHRHHGIDTDGIVRAALDLTV